MCKIGLIEDYLELSETSLINPINAVSARSTEISHNSFCARVARSAEISHNSFYARVARSTEISHNSLYDRVEDWHLFMYAVCFVVQVFF